VIATCLLLDHHLAQPLGFSTMPIRLSAELIYMVVQQLDDLYDKPTLLTLATTTRALSDAALDILWARPDLWNVAERMDESLWYIETTQEPSGYDDTVRQKRVSDTLTTMHISTPNIDADTTYVRELDISYRFWRKILQLLPPHTKDHHFA
jgi:hypothetical protein